MKTEKKLGKLSKELAALRKHIAMYSGVSKEESKAVDNLATDIAEQAAEIAREAREAAGNRSAKGLVKRVRKALGYAYP